MKCQHWPTRDMRCQAEAKYLLYAPDGQPVPGGQSCKAHTDGPIREYRDKLGQEWYAVAVDEYGKPIPLTPIYRARVVPESVQHSDFGCANCLWAGVECKGGELYTPAEHEHDTSRRPAVPSCGAYVYCD